MVIVVITSYRMFVSLMDKRKYDGKFENTTDKRLLIYHFEKCFETQLSKDCQYIILRNVLKQNFQKTDTIPSEA